jgi:hypothetical protein
MQRALRVTQRLLVRQRSESGGGGLADGVRKEQGKVE